MDGRVVAKDHAKEASQLLQIVGKTKELSENDQDRLIALALAHAQTATALAYISHI